MKRPHFPIGGRSVSGSGGRPGQSSPGFAVQRGLGDGQPQPTAIENLRRLMDQDSGLTESRIAELRDRIARGEFLTRQAAESTASRLVDDGFDLG